MTFKELGLNSSLLKAVEDLGFTEPTPIQAKTIPAILESKQDLIGLAQTGTGKTAAFGLPILHQIDSENKKPQAIILCPTRELGMQIHSDLQTFSKYLNNDIKSLAVYGGTSIVPQIKELKSGCQVIVGTPGRTLDLIRRKALQLKNIEYLVLDEADEMLNMGFKEDIDTILSETPEGRQTLLYSATMPKEIRQIGNNYMNNPIEFSAGKKNIGAENVSHIYYVTHAKNRYEALKRIVDVNPQMYSIIFCRTRRDTKEIADKLMQEGYNADALHGDLSQSQRDFVMNRFRLKHLQILVATDVAARGLDVNDLTHVINYNLPDDNEAYIHRSGRTGRAGKKGISASLIHTKEFSRIKSLEKKVGQTFEHKQVPQGIEICEKQLFNLIDKVEKVKVDETEINKFLPDIYKKLNWLSREELIQHFVSVEFNQFLEYYKNSGDINASVKKEAKDQKERKRGVDKYSRFYINVGIKNGLTPPKMIGLINDACNRRDINIGKIDMMKRFSFFEVDSKHEQEILKGFKGLQFENTSLTVQLSTPDSKGEADQAPPKKKKRKRNK